MRSLFADVRRSEGLGDSELSVLSAVVEADRPPTVPQIGRSYGQPRQVVQRAANSLIVAGLIETTANPDHKRAVLLRATRDGQALKDELDARADEVAAVTAVGIDAEAVKIATAALRTVRIQLEARMRMGDKHD